MINVIIWCVFLSKTLLLAPFLPMILFLSLPLLQKNPSLAFHLAVWQLQIFCLHQVQACCLIRWVSRSICLSNAQCTLATCCFSSSLEWVFTFPEAKQSPCPPFAGRVEWHIFYKRLSDFRFQMITSKSGWFSPEDTFPAPLPFLFSLSSYSFPLFSCLFCPDKPHQNHPFGKCPSCLAEAIL